MCGLVLLGGVEWGEALSENVESENRLVMSGNLVVDGFRFFTLKHWREGLGGFSDHKCWQFDAESLICWVGKAM